MRNIYAIRDRLAKDLVGIQMYLLLIFRTDQQAVRYFADAILDEKSILNKHPDDYELIICGAVEDDGTLIQNLNAVPRIVITGSALLAAQTPHLTKEA